MVLMLSLVVPTIQTRGSSVGTLSLFATHSIKYFKRNRVSYYQCPVIDSKFTSLFCRLYWCSKCLKDPSKFLICHYTSFFFVLYFWVSQSFTQRMTWAGKFEDTHWRSDILNKSTAIVSCSYICFQAYSPLGKKLIRRKKYFLPTSEFWTRCICPNVFNRSQFSLHYSWGAIVLVLTFQAVIFISVCILLQPGTWTVF